jgi:dephospho-CoA kinase
MNILHVAVISKLTAGIINAVQKLVVGDIYLYFKYFISELETKCAIQFIYLKTSPEICMERIKKRDRVEEKDIPIEYLISLDKLHDEWLINNSIILNGNTDISDKTNILSIKDFIKLQLCQIKTDK